MSSVDDEDGEPLSPMARVLQLPGNDCCVITMIGCKNKIDADVILSGLNKNVSKHPRFSTKLSNDGSSWIKTQVNIEDHVFVVDTDLKEIGEDGESFVEDYVSRLTMLPLDKSRPLWDMHIVNIKTSDAEAVCVIRSHHSLGDGTSLMSLLVACTRKTSHHDTISSTVPVLKRRKTVHKDKIPWLLRSVLTVFLSVKLIWNTFVDLLLVLAIALFLKDTKTPLKGDVGVENNNQRKFSHRIVSLEDIKLIKEVMNMTINDVLLGVTQAALSRYLSNFPGRIRLTAGVLVNLRSDIGIQPLVDMMAKDSKCRWGNYFSSIYLPLSIGLETDPLVYLTKAKSNMDRKKHSLVAALVYSSSKLVYNTFFGDKVSAILAKRLFANTTTLISNIIGPVEEINFQGNPIAYIAPSAYGHSHALTIHFLSYAEKMVISIGVDPTAVPNPHKLCDEMEDTLKAMKATLLERGLL
ncbi:unnamed protein product [Microthlaspi erraticum]|uniref:Uncharacterized protein n=1 Tax=Microthlaspi erraticum TaxID=1685480 RepID=A0A6D2KTK3_9BRAS|nr:unnamed protein product [Microthlaspi erraticum]